MADKIDDWKEYLRSKHLYNNKSSFPKIMSQLDNLISAQFPSAKGMIWRNGNINPNASINDVNQTLFLLSKFGQANLDDLGNPSDPNRLSGTPLNSMFISQEDSKLDEWTPENNQNQGRQGSSTPIKNPPPGKNNLKKNTPNIDDRMVQLTKLMDQVKK
jgi:hypothetical protein